MGNNDRMIPQGWAIATVAEVLKPLDGKRVLHHGWSPKCHKHPAPSNEDWGVLKTTAVQFGHFLSEHNKALPERLQPRPQLEVRAGDLLLTCAGPRVRCGIPCLVRRTRPRLMLSGKMYRFRAAEGIDPRFLEAHLMEPETQGHIDKIKTGSSDSGLNLTHARFSQMRTRVAPTVEQRAIVEKIEALFSELDKGVEQLQAVRAQLKRYRQAVLKAAFEGKLTADWRAQQKDLPTADELLEQIKAEREARYQQQLEQWQRAVTDWEAAGGKGSGQKKPRKPAKPKDLAPLTASELADLPDLPDGWTWCRLGLGIEDPQYGTSKKCRTGTHGMSVLRIPNMMPGRIDSTDLKHADFTEEERAQYALAPGDILIIRSNGSVSLVGRPALVTPNDTIHLFAGYLVRLRPNGPAITSDFLVQCLMSHHLRVQIEDKARSTSGVNNINSSEIRSLIIPVCAPDEQRVVTQEIDSRFSVLDKLEQAVETGMEQAEALRQSILKKGFEGRLLSEAELAVVRAHPDYEPADKLLERISVEREQADETKAKPIRKRKPGQPTRRLKLPAGERYRQAAFAAYAVNRLADRPTFGRTQLMKFLYLVPHVLEQESHIHAQREVAGPWDPAIYKIESLAKANRQRWFTVRQAGHRLVYRRGDNIDAAIRFAVDKMGSARPRVDRLLEQFAKWDTEEAELVATTFAVWNDYLIDGQNPTDEQIVEGVHAWHESKAKFDASRIRRCIERLRNSNLVPMGTGSHSEPIGGAA